MGMSRLLRCCFILTLPTVARPSCGRSTLLLDGKRETIVAPTSRGGRMPNFPESLDLEMLFDGHVDLEPPQDLGTTPLGARRIFIVKGGTFEGPKLLGTVLPGGGDWWLGLSNQAGELDVRATLRTEDGA